jgi:hypothetical protein
VSAPRLPAGKFAAGGLAGALSSLVVFILERCGVDVPADVATALITVIAFVVAMTVPEQALPPAAPTETDDTPPQPPKDAA